MEKFVGVFEGREKKTSKGGKPYSNITVGGKKFTAWGDLSADLDGIKGGDTVEVVFETDGKFTTARGISIQVGNVPQGASSPADVQSEGHSPYYDRATAEKAKNESIMIQVAFKMAEDYVARRLAVAELDSLVGGWDAETKLIGIIAGDLLDKMYACLARE